MSLDPDVVIDRRALKRKLSLWRVVAVIALVVAIIAGLAAGGVLKGFSDLAQPQIARISIDGFISPDRKLLDLFDQVGKSDAVKGVIIDIDSGGGASVGGEAIYEATRRLAAKKPTVAFISSIGASAAYMIALGADHIVARQTALTASIGVLAEWPDVSKLLDTVGVKFEAVRSAPNKGLPDAVTPTTPEVKAMLNVAIQGTFQYFLDLVADRRHLPMDEVKRLADGRVVIGTQAKDLKLIDDVGEESVAVTWLETERHVQGSLPIHDWKPKKSDLGFFSMEAASDSIMRGIMSAIGLDRDLRAMRTLDGLQSVWHPAAEYNTKTSEGINK
jgi:protease-4